MIFSVQTIKAGWGTVLTYKGVFTWPALIQDKNIWYLGRCSNNIDESYKIYLFIFYINKPSESSVLVYSIQDGRDSI